MAGGYSLVVAGTAITASRENQYVGRQVITRFANASARDSAIATDAEEGMWSDLADVDELTRHNGTLWKPALGKLLDATNVTITPVIAAAAFSSETDMPRMQLTATVESGSAYVFAGQGSYSFTNADTEGDIRIRHTTAVTGTLIGRIRLGKVPGIGVGYHFSWHIPWVADTSGSTNFYFSVKRGTGTGNISVDGGDATFSSLYRIGAAGTIRNIST